MVPVFFDDRQGFRQQGYFYRDPGFLAAGADPPVAIGAGDNAGGCQVAYVNVCQPGVAAENKQVLDQLDAFDGVVLFFDQPKLFCGQKLAFHFLEFQLVSHKGVPGQPFQPDGQIHYFSQALQMFHDAVIGHYRLAVMVLPAAQELLEIGNKFVAQLGQVYILCLVALLKNASTYSRVVK